MIESSKSAGYLVLLVAMAGGRTDCAATEPGSPDGGGSSPDAGVEANGGGSPADAATLDATSEGAEDARGDDVEVDAADLDGAADAPASAGAEASAPLDAPGGDDGPATDPLSIVPATTFGGPLIMQAFCGTQPAAGQFTITNVSGAPVTWSASDAGTATPLFSVSPAGSTLAPGASVAVAVTGPPIPAVTQVGITEVRAFAVTSASSDQTFTDDIVVAEAADGCNVMLTPASLDFGEVPVGSTAMLSATLTFGCYGPEQGFSEPVVPMGTPFVASKIMGGATVSFTPQATGAVQSTLADELVSSVICSAPSDYTVPLTGTGI